MSVNWEDVNDALYFGILSDPDSYVAGLADEYKTASDPKFALTNWSSDPVNDLKVIALRQALEDLWGNGTTIAAGVLEAGHVATNPIVLFNNTGDEASSGSRKGTNSTTINFDDFSGSTPKYYMAFDGKMKPFTIHRTLIHELIHGIEELDDVVEDISGFRHYNEPNYNFLGPTVEKTNLIREEMGQASREGRAGYDATFQLNVSDGDFGSLDLDKDYAPISEVDLVYGDRQDRKPVSDWNKLDTSMRTDASRDLLFGFGGQSDRGESGDTMQSGAGRDYLYGGIGDDHLYGGSGVDILHGGVWGEDVPPDGADWAHYEKGDLGNTTTHGITVSFDLNVSRVLYGQSRYVCPMMGMAIPMICIPSRKFKGLNLMIP